MNHRIFLYTAEIPSRIPYKTPRRSWIVQLLEGKTPAPLKESFLEGCPISSGPLRILDIHG